MHGQNIGRTGNAHIQVGDISPDLHIRRCEPCAEFDNVGTRSIGDGVLPGACVKKVGIITFSAIQRVVTRTAVESIVSGITGKVVVTGKTVDPVVTGSGVDHVVAWSAAKDGHRCQCCHIPHRAVGELDAFNIVGGYIKPALYSQNVGRIRNAYIQIGKVAPDLHICCRKPRAEPDDVGTRSIGENGVLSGACVKKVGIITFSAIKPVITSTAVKRVTSIATRQDIISIISE